MVKFWNGLAITHTLIVKCGEVKSKSDKKIIPPISESDDAEAVQLHLDKLDKELKKKGPTDSDKITRVLSLTCYTEKQHFICISYSTSCHCITKVWILYEVNFCKCFIYIT